MTRHGSVAGIGIPEKNEISRSGIHLGSFRDLVPDHLAIDTRALGVFRIGLGSLILWDLLNRARFLVEHYTDAGVLPRAALLAEHNPLRFSIHLLSGAVWVQVALFVLAGLLALALLFGVRTRVATVISWLLLASLHARNPYILNSGDTLLRLFLFWGMFLPLGASYSVDRALDRSGSAPPRRYRTMPAAALLLQVLLVYLTTAVFKFHPVWLTEGTAVQHALMLDEFTTALGRSLLEFPELLRAATHGTMLLEIVAPLVLLVPAASDRLRTLIVAAFVTFHGSFLFLMVLGLFPLISILGWVVFLPPSFWDRVSGWLHAPRARQVTIYYDRQCPFCRKMLRIVLTFFALPGVRTRAAQHDPRTAAALRTEGSWIVETHDARWLYRVDGLAYLAMVSRVARPLGLLLRLRFVRAGGNAFYRWVARRRSAATAVFRIILPWRTGSWSTRRATEIVVLVLIGYVCAWNVAGLQSRQGLPDPARWPGDVLRLGQRWSMFAPYPLRLSGWWEVRATAADGREWDLVPTVRHARLATGSPPASALDDLQSRMWRKYFTRVRQGRTDPANYARHLCGAWAERFPERPALEWVELRFHYRRTIPDTNARGPWQVDEVHTESCAG